MSWLRMKAKTCHSGLRGAVMISLSYRSGNQMLLLGDATVFYDYFECPDDGCETVILMSNGHITCMLSFIKGREFMRLMSEEGNDLNK